MSTPVALNWKESYFDACSTAEGFFCSLAPEMRSAFTGIAYSASYPEGSILFAEEEQPRGVFVVVRGRVKVSMTSAEGKTVILRIAKPGEAVGLHAVLSGEPFQATAETLELSQVLFAKRDPFLHFLHSHPEASLEAAKQLGVDYHMACEQVRALGLLHSAPRKLAGFLLEWASSGRPAKDGIRAKLTLTHEEIGQMIGTSRETVTRTLADFKHQHYAMLKGSTLVIQNRAALQHFAEV